jgi:hypothetical protein
MSISAAMNNFMVWNNGHQHERLDSEEQHPTEHLSSRQLQEAATQQPIPIANNNVVVVETVSEDEDEANGLEEIDIENQMIGVEVSPEGNITTTTSSSRPTVRTSRRISLADLEEERELARRRTSACVLLAVFILFRVWIQAIATGDFMLLVLCLMGTHFTARFIRNTREREEELDRLIQEYVENSEGDGVSRNDVRLMSFQAQLALALMESQRQVSMGGYGHPDGQSGAQGVSEQAKGNWDIFSYKAQPTGVETKKGTYGSVAQKELDCKSDAAEEEPHCSICLSEYEEGDKLVCLPCKHVYHEDCVGSWCTNHVRCPLCNFDLESVPEESVAVP